MTAVLVEAMAHGMSANLLGRVLEQNPVNSPSQLMDILPYQKHNTVKTRTPALWRLGLWGLTRGSLSWRMIFRRQTDFRTPIPSVGTAPAPT